MFKTLSTVSVKNKNPNKCKLSFVIYLKVSYSQHLSYCFGKSIVFYSINVRIKKVKGLVYSGK